MNAAFKILRDARLLPLKTKLVVGALLVLPVVAAFVHIDPHYF